ncbi:MAG TPA: T9SS type A sorting domain-containing protein [Bacteroidia bacterium]|nr:T9SS type A sorting domain-containing protein [Bacteroidia bacterium]
MAGTQASTQKAYIFNVTPNPGSGIFNLTANAMDDKAMLYVEDMFGKNILQQKVNNYKTTLNLNNLPKGVYFVKYFCYNTMQSKKVIIQ